MRRNTAAIGRNQTAIGRIADVRPDAFDTADVTATSPAATFRAPGSLSALFALVALLLLALPGPVWSAPPSAPSAGAAPAAADEWIYRVQPGDTLIGVHAQWLRPDADWRVVQRLNRLANPRRLQPGSLLRIPLALLREEPGSAELVHVQGDVWLERAGSPRQALAAGAALRAADVLSTGAQSSASLRLSDGSRSLIGPDTRLVVERLVRLGAAGVADTRIRLDTGSVDNRVTPARPAPRFEVTTPVVNLGVRGTDFRARSDGRRTQAEVLEGRVAMGPQLLEPGFGSLASASGVSPPRPLLAAPDLSALPERVERVPLQLTLGRAAGAVRYRAQIFDTREPDRLVLDGLFEQPVAAWIDSPPDGRYELRVRASDADGIEGQDARRAFTLKARPEPPFQLRPRAAERIQDSAVTLAWARNAEAARYRLQIALQSSAQADAKVDLTDPVVQRDDLTANELSVPLPIGRYAWRVASVRPDGDVGPWGDPQVFERIDPPPAPAAEPPRLSDEGVMLAWSVSPLAGAKYQVQVARDAAFKDLVLDETIERTERLLAKPAPGTYHARVRTVGADGRAGSFGSPQVIEVPRSWWWLWLVPLPLLLLL